MRFVKNHIVQNVVLLSVILVMVVPYAVSCFYAFPSCDDYAFSLMRQDYVKEHGANPLNAFSQVIEEAIEGGYNFSVLTILLLNPLRDGGLTPLRICLCCFLLLFIASLLTLSAKLCGSFLEKSDCRHALFLTAILCFCFLNILQRGEVFYYFVVTSSYLTTISAALFAGAFLLDYISTGHTSKLILSALTAAYAASAPPNIGALCCFLLLFIAAWALLCKRSKPVVCIPLFAAVIVILLYLLLPGPIKRAGGSLHVLSALQEALSFVIARTWILLSSTVFPVLLIAFGLFVSYNVTNQRKTRLFSYPWCAILAVILIPAVVQFPVSLGYPGWTPIRCAFVTEAAIYLVSLAATAYIVLFFKSCPPFFKRQKAIRKSLTALGCALCAASLAFGTPALSYPVALLSRELYSGKLEANRRVWEDTLDSLKDQQDQNVALYIDPDVKSDFLLYPSWFIHRDPQNLLNTFFARYYHLAFVSSDCTYDFSAFPEKANDE